VNAIIALAVTGGLFAIMVASQSLPLSLFIVFATTGWVMMDSREKRISSGSGEYSNNNGAFGWLVGCLLLWVLVFPYYIMKRGKVLRERAASGATTEGMKQEYQDGLTRLKADPAAPDLRERALKLGRAYAEAARKVSGSGFDEATLRYDIDTACAKAAPAAARPVEERLVKLKQLRAAGHIEESEYASRRQTILDEL
jgi:hypothetical protein